MEKNLYMRLMQREISVVFSAWDSDKLVGMARVLDDSELAAFIHNVLVLPPCRFAI